MIFYGRAWGGSFCLPRFCPPFRPSRGSSSTRGSGPMHAGHKIWAVAEYEFIGAVTRLGYLVTLIGMPAFMACLLAVTSLATVRSATESLSRKRTIGIVDESGLFASSPESIETELLPELGKIG